MLDIKTREIAMDAYISLKQKMTVKRVADGVLLMINNFILGIILGKQCFHLFDFPSKN